MLFKSFQDFIAESSKFPKIEDLQGNGKMYPFETLYWQLQEIPSHAKLQKVRGQADSFSQPHGDGNEVKNTLLLKACQGGNLVLFRPSEYVPLMPTRKCPLARDKWVVFIKERRLLRRVFQGPILAAAALIY